jgi:hypothetical protein
MKENSLKEINNLKISPMKWSEILKDHSIIVNNTAYKTTA